MRVPKFYIHRILLVAAILGTSFAQDGSTDNNNEETTSSTSDTSSKRPESSTNSWDNPPPRVTEEELLAELIPSGYNRFEVPRPQGQYKSGEEDEPVQVSVSLKIHSVLEIDEDKERLTLDLDADIQWRDYTMLSYAKRSEKGRSWRALDPTFLDKIWTPDVYIESMISASRAGLMKTPAYLRLKSSFGAIIYKFRLSPVIKCGMEFKYYPADIQTCQFVLRSYAYSYDDVHLAWSNGVYLVNPDDANFDIQVSSQEQERIVFTRTYEGVGYDTLKFTILARRKLSYHILQTYVPSTLFVGITWLCFLLPVRMIEARIGISMTTLLTLTAMFASVRESTPTVSYVKAIDIWMVVCIIFVFAVLLEFSIFVWIRAVQEKLEGLNKRGSEEEDDVSSVQNEEAKRASSRSINSTVKLAIKIAYKIESFALLIYASVFIIFTIVYWYWLLASGKYFDWEVNERYNKIEQS